VIHFRQAWILGFLLAGLCACGTSDQARIRDAKDAFVHENYVGTKADLLTVEIAESDQNRVIHFLMLGETAFAQGSYGEAIHYFNEARTLSNQHRSSWHDSFLGYYGGQTYEYSWIHSYLALSYARIADQGKIMPWSVPEIKKGDKILIPGSQHAEKVLSPQEVFDYRGKARSEMLAWDSHLENLQRVFAGSQRYQTDPYARLLGGWIHAQQSDPDEWRTAEILSDQAPPDLQPELKAFIKNSEQNNVKDSRLILAELGTVPSLRKRTTRIGISLLFKNIQNPQLRRQLEMIGMYVLLQVAPEFGLVMFGGAVAGAVSEAGSPDAPLYFTDAVDDAFGFEVSLPWMDAPKPIQSAELDLYPVGAPAAAGTTGGASSAAPIVFPLHEALAAQSAIANDYVARLNSDFRAKAIHVGLEYLAILIPAVVLYINAGKHKGTGAIFEKLGIVASFFVAKKALDAVNGADLRSWPTLPVTVQAAIRTLPAGRYNALARVKYQDQSTVEENFGEINVSDPDRLVLLKKPESLPLGFYPRN